MASVDRSLPLFGVRSIEQMLGFVLLPMRVAAIALGAFGVLAVMLAATGIHGVVSYAVARRRREIAIRLAVGATERNILQLVLRRIALLMAIGSLCGVVLTLALGGLLSRIVYQAAANDFGSLSVVVTVVGFVGISACWLPARRALRVDPAAALHLD